MYKEKTDFLAIGGATVGVIIFAATCYFLAVHQTPKNFSNTHLGQNEKSVEDPSPDSAKSNPFEDEIMKALSSYWKSFIAGKLAETAEYIYPPDLAVAKEALLPVFISAQEYASEDNQLTIELFFGDTPKIERNNLSPKEVFIGVNRILADYLKNFTKSLSGSSIEITNITSLTDDSYKVEFNATTAQGKTVSSSEVVILEGGTWYFRVKEDPYVTAQKFESLFRN
ncbi:MAG: hypothetical protein AAF546_09070 [Verrucomicrobiota bacterium]